MTAGIWLGVQMEYRWMCGKMHNDYISTMLQLKVACMHGHEVRMRREQKNNSQQDKTQLLKWLASPLAIWTIATASIN